MKKLKYILSMVLLVILPCFILVGCNKKEETFSYSDYEFELSSDQSYYKIALYKGHDADLEIPSEYNGKPVQEIEDYAFMGSDCISIKIPDSIKTIGKRAFFYCYKLRNIYIGKGIELMDGTIFQCSFSDILNITIENTYLFEKITETGDYWISSYALYIIKVPKSVADNATNDYLNNTDNFTKTTDGDYYIYTRVTD